MRVKLEDPGALGSTLCRCEGCAKAHWTFAQHDKVLLQVTMCPTIVACN
jgi:hypothetical protein